MKLFSLENRPYWLALALIAVFFVVRLELWKSAAVSPRSSITTPQIQKFLAPASVPACAKVVSFSSLQDLVSGIRSFGVVFSGQPEKFTLAWSDSYFSGVVLEHLDSGNRLSLVVPAGARAPFKLEFDACGFWGLDAQ